MEQVLVLNGLASLVDTRGTGATCEQRDDGTVGCLDTPLGLSAAQAAQTGGETAAYVAGRLDVLSQESRNQATRETMRADALVAASQSAESIGNFGSASVAARAAEAARVKARAALAQSAAAAAAAQAVRLGDAPRARMAGDAVVAAAWKGELAEVQSGALQGLQRLGVASERVETVTSPPITLTAGSTTTINGVEKFSVAPPDVVVAQNGPSALTLYGGKAGEAVLTYKLRGIETPYQKIITVKAITPEQGLALAKNVFEQISNLLGEPVLNIDWQDAGALRINAISIRQVLDTVVRSARSWGADGAVYEGTLLTNILQYIVDNPDIVSLREALIKYYGSLGIDVFAVPSLKRTGRECEWKDRTNFYPLWKYAYDEGIATDIGGITLITLGALATIAATVFSAGAVAAFAAPAATVAAGASAGTAAAAGAATAAGTTAAAAATTVAGAATGSLIGSTLAIGGSTLTLISGAFGAVAGGAATLASYLPQFKADPDRLVKSFGAAVCAAVNDGAMPRRARAGDRYRTKADQYARFYRQSMTVAAAARTPEIRAEWLAKAKEQRALGQTALAQLMPFDDPRFYTVQQNKRLIDTKEILNKDDELLLSELQTREASRSASRSTGAGSKSTGGGGGGAIVAAGGAAAAAFILWRFLR